MYAGMYAGMYAKGEQEIETGNMVLIFRTLFLWNRIEVSMVRCLTIEEWQLSKFAERSPG